MSTIISDITKALEIHASQILIPIYGDEISWPNMVYTPKAGQPWALVSHLFAKPSIASAGIDGEVRRSGILQVSLFDDLGVGQKGIQDSLDALQEGFSVGLGLILNGTTIRILTAQPGPPIPGGQGWYGRPLSIDWFVYSTG